MYLSLSGITVLGNRTKNLEPPVSAWHRRRAMPKNDIDSCKSCDMNNVVKDETAQIIAVETGSTKHKPSAAMCVFSGRVKFHSVADAEKEGNLEYVMKNPLKIPCACRPMSAMQFSLAGGLKMRLEPHGQLRLLSGLTKEGNAVVGTECKNSEVSPYTIPKSSGFMASKTKGFQSFEIKKYESKCAFYKASGKCSEDWLMRSCAKTCGSGKEDMPSLSKAYLGPLIKPYDSLCALAKTLNKCNVKTIADSCLKTCAGSHGRGRGIWKYQKERNEGEYPGPKGSIWGEEEELMFQDELGETKTLEARLFGEEP